MNNEFSKKDLRDGDKFTMRDGRERIIKDDGIFEVMTTGRGTELVRMNFMTCYTEDLKDKDGQSFLDIMKIERQSTATIFKRVEPIVLAKGEIYNLKNRVVRFECVNSKNSDNIDVFSQHTFGGEFFQDIRGVSVFDRSVLLNVSSAQKAALIAAEIENGYLWDDKSKTLIKFK